MTTDFILAINQLTAEKGLPPDTVYEAVESALGAAFKRDHGIQGLIHVTIDRETGVLTVWSERTVVEVEEDIADEEVEIDLEAARRHDPSVEIGGTLRLDHELDAGGGRIAAQTAKQVVLQRLREAEREAVFEEFSGQEGELVSGVVQRVEGRQMLVDLERAEAVLPAAEQVRMEHLRPGQRVRVYVVEVLQANKGPQVVVSRTHKDLVRRLFELEVPEIFKGQVEIKGIAREPGHRTKIAVHSDQEGVDPVGACVGMRGMRIQNIVNELQGERIDVILWDPSPRKFVAHALSPAQVVAVRIDRSTNTAEVAVPDSQLSLAIGKEGQNARLAARLTKMRIDIKPQSLAEELREQGLGPYAAEPEEEAAPVEVAPAGPAPEIMPAPAEVKEEAVAAGTTAAAADAARITPEFADEGAEEETGKEELEPVLAAVELSSRPSAPGRIRFAEDVLQRPAEQPARPKKQRRVRYEETDEGLEEDPYGEYSDTDSE